MTRMLFLGLLCALALALLPRTSWAQQEGADATAVSPEAMEKMMREFAALAPEHEHLKQHVGKWKTEMKSFYENPDQPTTHVGKANFKLIMGGRYLQQLFQGEFDGEKYQGMGISGYDKIKKKYVGIWIDSMGTSMMTTEGTFDEATGMMTEIGESESPLGKMRTKMVTKLLSDDSFLFTMHMLLPDGSEKKTMEITYTRTKK